MNRKRQPILLVTALVLAVLLPQTAGAQTDVARPRVPFITSARPQLEALSAGVEITPLITTGDVIGGRLGGYQFSGAPDGIGAYQSAPGRYEVFLNHETSHYWGDAADARISHLTLNANANVLAASYPVDGREGYWWFCSSTLAYVDGVPWYFTGEEWARTPRGGMAIAMNALTGRVVETPQFGSMAHENVIPVPDLARSVVLLPEDSRGGRAQIWAYFADSVRDAIKGRGTLRTWVPDSNLDGDPSPADISKGQSLTGRFVTVKGSERMRGERLNDAANELGAMDFVRIEDAAYDPAQPGVTYWADTGAATKESRQGRLYRFVMDPSRPSRATLEVILDGDDGDPITNPDNLGISDEALVIQEDRNFPASGYNRVWTWDLTTQSLTKVARTDPTERAMERAGGPGAWESTGVVDVSEFFGDGAWLMNVMAHYTNVRQPGPDLRIDSGKGGGGQLLLVRIPGT
jgi:hypothetical protein